VGVFNDLTGQLFGSLLVLERVENSKSSRVMWLVRCIVEWCGKDIIVAGCRLYDKKQPMIHCGCLTFQNHIGNITHGQSKTIEYRREHRQKRRIKIKNLNSDRSLSYEGSLKESRAKLAYCVYCLSTEQLTTDHIVPISKKGNQDLKNLATACTKCNNNKRASFFIDWFIKTNRVKRSLNDILKDMGFDSIVHLQNYQDAMCPKHIEKDPNVRFRKLCQADQKDTEFLESYYRSLL